MITIPADFDVSFTGSTPCPPLSTRCSTVGASVGVLIKATSAEKLAAPGARALEAVVMSSEYKPANPAGGQPSPLWEYEFALADDVLADGETLTAADIECVSCRANCDNKWLDERLVGLVPNITAVQIEGGDLEIVGADGTVLFTIPGASAGVESVELVGDVLTITTIGGESWEITLPSGGGGDFSCGALSDCSLSAFGDVSDATPDNGDTLVWDAGDEIWVPQATQASILLQFVRQPFEPVAKQSLTTTYADVNGSSISVTPVSADSVITYEFEFQMSSETNTDAVLANLRLLLNGVAQTQGKATYYVGTSAGGGLFARYAYSVASWGTSARTMKLQAREYSSTNEVKLHETLHADGSLSNLLVNAVLTITETLT